MTMIGKTFEQEVIRIIADEAERQKIRQKPLAKLVWPEHSDPAAKWRTMRNTGVSIYLCDAYRMAKLLGMSFVEVCALAQARLMESHNMEDPEPLKPGRSAKPEATQKTPPMEGVCPNAWAGVPRATGQD